MKNPDSGPRGELIPLVEARADARAMREALDEVCQKLGKKIAESQRWAAPPKMAAGAGR